MIRRAAAILAIGWCVVAVTSAHGEVRCFNTPAGVACFDPEAR